MSKALIDVRLAIDEATDVWIEAEASAFGTDKQAVIRSVLREWAKKKSHAYRVATKRLKANGLQPELFSEDER